MVTNPIVMMLSALLVSGVAGFNTVFSDAFSGAVEGAQPSAIATYGSTGTQSSTIFD
jgi:hypothetical protein